MKQSDNLGLFVDEKVISGYIAFLEQEEKSRATIEKCEGVINRFKCFLQDRELTKEEKQKQPQMKYWKKSE